MTDTANRLSINEAKSQLFQSITYMPEAERQKFLFVLLAEQSKDKNSKLLSLVLANISEARTRELLGQLKNWHKSKLTQMREHPRKPFFIPVECSSSDDVCFTDFIQDISCGGVFIQTDGNFYVGRQITLTFFLPKAENDITVSGKVVRVDSEGIGVKFNEPLTAL